MNPPTRSADVLIVGGGFFGCSLALYFRNLGADVVIAEASGELLSRASFVNQARIHNGYHYPRSLLTALRSRVNFPFFVEDFPESSVHNFTKLYAIAANSKLNANQFERFCRTIGAEVAPASKELAAMFDKDLIERAFLVKEYAFNSRALRDVLRGHLDRQGVPILFNAMATKIEPKGDRLLTQFADGTTIESGKAVNSTYSRINTFLRASQLPIIPMKHEIAEVALISPPPSVAQLGITIMDGPFWSSMPFPARGLHSLTHVRYTPHENWLDANSDRDPYRYLQNNPPQPRAIFMQRDAARFMPAMRDAKIVDSLFEVKTVLPQNEGDDGRPILYRKDHGLPGLSIVMGGKIDNVYDILHAVREAEEGVRSDGIVSPLPKRAGTSV